MKQWAVLDILYINNGFLLKQVVKLWKVVGVPSRWSPSSETRRPQRSPLPVLWFFPPGAAQKWCFVLNFYNRIKTRTGANSYVDISKYRWPNSWAKRSICRVCIILVGTWAQWLWFDMALLLNGKSGKSGLSLKGCLAQSHYFIITVTLVLLWISSKRVQPCLKDHTVLFCCFHRTSTKTKSWWETFLFEK